MKFRISLYSLLTLLVVGIVIGSFCDLSISQALCQNSDDFFLHTVTAFGLVIPYMFFGLFGGALFRVTLNNKDQKTWLKAILYFMSVFFCLAGAYYSAQDNFSVNGLYHPEMGYTILAYVIGFLFNGIGFALGFIGAKSNENKNAWIVIMTLAGSIIVSQLVGISALKSLFNRPRFRSLGNGIEFFPWYKPNLHYKDLLGGAIVKEEFKSFPSGHSSISALMMFYAIFVPLMFPKHVSEKVRFPLFLVGLAYYIFMGSVRILAGAHFLSDVCFGGLITVLFTIIPYEILSKTKLLKL